MTDGTNIGKAAQRIVTGWLLMAVSALFLVIGGASIVERLGMGQAPEAVSLVLSTLGIAALIPGLLLIIDGITARRQTKTGYQGLPKPPTAPRPAAATVQGKATPATAGEIPERHALEEPATKSCPGCKKAVYKEARVCRFCGHAFGVTLRLKVYPPQDKKLYEHVVAILSQKLKMPEDKTAHLLDLGMRFKYDSADKLAAAREKFKSLGCRTEVYEKAGRE